jgi:hypothetical protein
MKTWNFSPIADVSRRSRLADAPDFEDIAQAVAGSMHILCTHPDRCDEEAGFMRLVCCVALEHDLFDIFFNAESGYRGTYFVSPEDGLRANSHLLALVAPALASHKIHSALPQIQAEHSLRAPSAKCWLAEVGKGFCPACQGEWTPPRDEIPDFLNGRWENGTEAKARWGRKAPRFTKLRMLGAFVNQSGSEYVTIQKRKRAQHIHDFGWS